jgi:hypothetical protein
MNRMRRTITFGLSARDVGLRPGRRSRFELRRDNASNLRKQLCHHFYTSRKTNKTNDLLYLVDNTGFNCVITFRGDLNSTAFYKLKQLTKHDSTNDVFSISASVTY